jgi:hypothetical protein
MFPDLFTIGYLSNERQREFHEAARLARLRRSGAARERLVRLSRFGFRRPAKISESLAS